MTSDQAKQLRVGDRVAFGPFTGTVTEIVHQFAVRFAWDDGAVSLMHVADMDDVEQLAEVSP